MTNQPTKIFNQNDVGANKSLAALSYIWILSVVLLLVKKDSQYVQFHAKQGTVLFAISVFIGLIQPLWPLNIVIVAIAIVGLIRAYRGQAWEIPFVKDLASKINIS